MPRPTARLWTAMPVALLAAVGEPAVPAAPPASSPCDHPLLVGDWLGELGLAAQPAVVRLVLREAAGEWSGSLSVPDLGLATVPLTGLVMHAAAVRFTVPVEGTQWSFTAALAGGELVGSGGAGSAGEPAPLRLMRLGPAPDLQALRGLYQAAAGRRFWIGGFPELGPDPFLLDFASGRFGPLYPAADGTLFSGPGLMLVFPPDLEVVPEPPAPGAASAEVPALTVRLGAGPPVRALRVPLHREEVRFASGAVSLAGTVTRPPPAGHRAALLLVHGSGPLDRSWLALWSDFFAGEGLVALGYDKRGTGSSTGDWRRADFAALAEDAIAGLELLRRRPDVDPARVGLWGVSQGGWIGPLVATRWPALAFLLLHAPPATTVAEQVLDHLTAELRAAGLSEQELRPAVTVAEASLAYDRAPSDESWARLQAAYRLARLEGAAWLPPERPRDDWFRAYLGRLLDFDPRPHLERTTCPLLAFFGERDTNVPAAKNQARMAAALSAAGNRDATLLVLPATNHLLLQAQNGGSGELPRLRAFAPEYFRRMAEWLAQQGLVAASAEDPRRPR